MGDWIYGCDICQEVCPWNQKHARPTDEPGYQSRKGLSPADLSELIRLDPTAFSKRFKGSPIKRAKRRGLLRNVAVAMGNRRRPEDVELLREALGDPEPLVRGHAAWALGQIGGEAAVRALRPLIDLESDSEVLEEIRSALKAAQRKPEKTKVLA
jgi:epoxyqueuosine reductase